MLNEKKYYIPSAIKKNNSKKSIQDDEPVFLLRAKDDNAVSCLLSYLALCQDDEYREAIQYAIDNFKVWRYENKSKCKEPSV